MASENMPDCLQDIEVGLWWPLASTVAVSYGVGGGPRQRPLPDGELRRELRRTNSRKGINRGDGAVAHLGCKRGSASKRGH
jgi:hypothetical protein